jgi:2-iminobutanoate/2-iminopropanoate deaminase
MWHSDFASADFASGMARPSRRALLAGAAGVVGAAALPGLTGSVGAAQAQPAWLSSEHPAFAVGATAGGLTFVAQDAAGPEPLPAGTVAQAERALQNLRRALASVGQSLDNVIFLQVLLTDYSQAPAVAKLVQAAFKPDRAPTTCFLGMSKLNPGRLVRMDAIATTIADRQQIVAKEVPPPLGSSVHAVRVGDLVFTGAVDAPDIPLEDDPTASALTLDSMERVLNAAGLTMKDSFRHWSFIRNLKDPKVNQAYGRGRNMFLDPIFEPSDFPANSRMGSPALGDGVAHRSYAVATRGKRVYVESPFARKMPSVFAQAVRAGDWLFIAGQDAVNVANRTLFVGDLRRQTEQCIQQLEWIVQAAGGTLDDIVKTTVYLMDGMDRQVFLDAYGEGFRRRLKGPWMPAGLTMDLDAMRTDCLVEIDAVAYLGKR